MGLFDSILGLFNPDVISTYNNLVNSHSEAFRRWRGKQLVGTLSDFFDFNPTYSDKSYIASHERDILALEKIIAEEKAFEKRRQEVIKAASNYPHAFVALLKKLSIASIPGMNATLPGQRKSKRTQRIEREARNASSHIGVNPSFIQPIHTFDSYITPKPTRSINTLAKEEYEKLHKSLSSLSSEESRIKQELQKEDKLFRFDDEILDNETRAKYYEKICEYKAIFGSEEQKKIYCVEHLADLDTYIRNEIETQYSTLKHKYPSGLIVFEGAHRSMSKWQIIDNESEIEKYEENYKLVNVDNEWEKAQKEFTQESRNLNNTILNNYGCYIYDIPFQKHTYEGLKTSGTYRVWQHFCNSYCDVEGLDYSYYPSARKNYNNIEEFRTKTLCFYDGVYDKIVTFIETLKQKYNNLIVALGDSAMGKETIAFNDYHFSHLKKSFGEKNIMVLPVDEVIKQSTLYSYIVVVEIISTNVGLIDICEKLIGSYKRASPKITYISLYKGYSEYEMTEIIKNEKCKKEQEEKAKKEEEERKERERQEKIRIEEERHRLKQSFQNAVKNWDSICGVVKYSYLFNYYPTTCNFEATDSEWDNRWLVWNFKNTPGKTSANEHTSVLNNVIPRLKNLLINTFGQENLKKVVLVCIPASSQQKTTLRYQDFSRILCSETGMISAYDKMMVTGERTAKHLGGTSSSMDGVQFESDFFKNKLVILFDDIVTKGNSMLSFKHKMENLGATVICGLSLGKTKHERPTSRQSVSIIDDDLPF